MARFFRRKKFCRFTADDVKQIDYKDLTRSRAISPRPARSSEPHHGTRAHYQRQLQLAIRRARFLPCCRYTISTKPASQHGYHIVAEVANLAKSAIASR